MLYVAEGYIRHVFWLATIYLQDVIKGLVSWNRFEICTWVLNFTRTGKNLYISLYMYTDRTLCTLVRPLFLFHSPFAQCTQYLSISMLDELWYKYNAIRLHMHTDCAYTVFRRKHCIDDVALPFMTFLRLFVYRFLLYVYKTNNMTNDRQ